MLYDIWHTTSTCARTRTRAHVRMRPCRGLRAQSGLESRIIKVLGQRYVWDIRTIHIVTFQGCWSSVDNIMLDGSYLETIEKVGFAETCQKHCRDHPECNYFLHRVSEQKCWLKTETYSQIQLNDDTKSYMEFYCAPDIDIE